jgi:hypothetical protein
MGKFATRRGMTIVAIASCSALLLASCSSDPEAEPATSSSAALPSASAQATDAATIEATGAAADACAAYFELDLLNSQYAGGAVADGDYTEEQIRAEFKALLKDMANQSQAALDDGSGDQKLVANSIRMRKIVRSLKKQEALSDLSSKQQERFAKSSLRVQKACDRAGFPLPEDNIIARTAAGLS